MQGSRKILLCIAAFLLIAIVFEMTNEQVTSGVVKEKLKWANVPVYTGDRRP